MEEARKSTTDDVEQCAWPAQQARCRNDKAAQEHNGMTLSLSPPADKARSDTKKSARRGKGVPGNQSEEDRGDVRCGKGDYSVN